MATHTQTVLVTPELAQEYLDRNTHNRKLRKTRTEKLARDMRAGNWRETHQGIAFDESGTLLDGQHRLAAVAESGCSLRMLVTWGVQRESQVNMDDHAPRSFADALSLAGVGDGSITNRTVATARCMMRAGRAGGTNTVTKDELASFIEDHAEAIGFAEDCFRGHNKKLVSAPIKAAIAVALYHEDAERLRHFAQVYGSGMGEGVQDSAAIVLRNHVYADPSQTRAEAGRALLYKKTLRAIKYFVNRAKTSRVTSQGEAAYTLPA